MISIIIPTKNNGDILERCLQSIEELDYPKDDLEVLIVDGNSTDSTLQIAKKFGCKIFFENIGTRGGACNVGVKNATGELIFFTDADCVVSKDWASNLIKYFTSIDVACVGGPNLTPSDDTEFAQCVGNVLTFLSQFGSRYGLNADQVIETFHNSGCNVAYTKDAILKAGMFNEDLITCEDEELDFRIKSLNYRILFTPDASVLHYRRPTWRSFFKQAYRYALGRMQAIKLHKEMGRYYHYSPPSILSIIVLSFVLLPLFPELIWVGMGILIGGAAGIFIMSLYLGTNSRIPQIFTYFGLISLWFWGSGIGSLRGLLK